METLIYFILGLVMGIAMMQIKIKSLKKENKALRGGGLNIVEQQAGEKADHKKQILEYIAGKESITNDDVEKLLGVSDSTVQRYFDELVADGKIKRNGETGKGVFYTKA